MPDLKKGDRVRYVNNYMADRSSVGKLAVVLETPRGNSVHVLVQFDGGEVITFCRVNFEHVEPETPLTPFEENLMAYIAAEKKELGLV